LEQASTTQSLKKAGARLVIPVERSLWTFRFFVESRAAAEEELDWIRPGAILAGFLHLASAQQDKIDVLLQKKKSRSLAI